MAKRNTNPPEQIANPCGTCGMDAKKDWLLCREHFVADIKQLKAENERLAGEVAGLERFRALRTRHGDEMQRRTTQLANSSETDQLKEQIGEWKDATGLIDSSGDPDGIEPEHLRKEIERLLARSVCECMNYACSSPEDWERVLAGKHHSSCKAAQEDPQIAEQRGYMELYRRSAKWCELAEAWKSVYERMLDCESGHPNKRRENALELARALEAARALEQDGALESAEPEWDVDEQLFAEAGEVLAKLADMNWSKQPLIGAELNGICARIAGRIEQGDARKSDDPEWIKTEDIEEDGWHWFSGVYEDGCEPIFELVRLHHECTARREAMRIGNICTCGVRGYIDESHWLGYWLPVNIEEPEPSVHDVKMRRHMGYEEDRCGAAFCDYECTNHEQEGGKS